MKAHKFRNSESNTMPKLVEFLQNGILIRFNINSEPRTDIEGQSSNIFVYQEFWFDLEAADIEEVVNSYGYQLSAEHKSLLSI